MNNILENLTIDREKLNEYIDLIQNKTILKGSKSTLSRKRKELNVYTEIHHYIPKSLGGTDSSENLVLLTGEDHFIAHWLLYKATMHKNMIFAFNQMSRYIKRHDASENLAKLYHDAREDISKALKDMAIARCEAMTVENKETLAKRMKNTCMERKWLEIKKHWSASEFP